MRSPALVRILYGPSGDYFVLAVLGALPILTAYYAGVLVTIGEYKGYGETQWALWPVVLPFVLWIVRTLWRRITPENAADAGVVSLFPARQAAAALLEKRTIRSVNLIAALALALLFSYLDAYDVLQCYRYATCTPFERDWSVAFLTGDVARRANLHHVVAAYGVQGVGILLGVLLPILCFRHNAFFIGSIYQRRWHQPRTEQIIVKFDDSDDCFGFGEAHRAFNAQVWMLMLTGPVFLLTRIPNANVHFTTEQINELSKSVLNIMRLDFFGFVAVVGRLPLFPDIGQKLLLVSWLLMLVVVTIPAFVKFLPAIPPKPKRGRQAVLLEFVPPLTAPFSNEPPGDEEIRAVAKKFARNSVWPTGDGEAKVLFFVAFFVLGWIIVPLSIRSSPGVLAVFVATLVVAAGAAVTAVMFLLKHLLGALGAGLVSPPD